MVKDLPDPWVCQITPDFSLEVFPVLSLSGFEQLELLSSIMRPPSGSKIVSFAEPLKSFDD